MRLGPIGYWLPGSCFRGIQGSVLVRIGTLQYSVHQLANMSSFILRSQPKFQLRSNLHAGYQKLSNEAPQSLGAELSAIKVSGVACHEYHGPSWCPNGLLCKRRSAVNFTRSMVSSFALTTRTKNAVFPQLLATTHSVGGYVVLFGRVERACQYIMTKLGC